MKKSETGNRFFVVYYTVMSAKNRTGPGRMGCRTKNGRMFNLVKFENEVKRRGLNYHPDDPVVLVVLNGYAEMTESDYTDLFGPESGMAPDYITFSSN